MNFQEQIEVFRSLLAAAGEGVDAFELNVAGDGFRRLLAGEGAELEVGCRRSGAMRIYSSDGTPAWLTQFAADLHSGVFAVRSTDA